VPPAFFYLDHEELRLAATLTMGLLAKQADTRKANTTNLRITLRSLSISDSYPTYS
jgi:hypothetical protein